MPPDEVNDKLIGRLEKGVEVLEGAFRNFQLDQNIRFENILKIIQSNHSEFRDELRNLNDKLDTNNQILVTQIETIKDNNVKLRLSVQKLATTVSVIVGIGIYLIKGVFDVAKNAIAGTFWPQ